jgi:hypothetical protein
MTKLLEKTKYMALIAVFFLLATTLFAFGWGLSKPSAPSALLLPVRVKTRRLRFL